MHPLFALALRNPFGTAWLPKRRGECWGHLSLNGVGLRYGKQAKTSVLSNASTSEALGWEPALQAWGQLWHSAGLRQQRVSLVLADRWARILAFDLPSGTRSDTDIAALAKIEHGRRFGTGAFPWHMDWIRVGDSVLVAACPQTLLQQLKDLLGPSDSQLGHLGIRSLELFAHQYKRMAPDGWHTVLAAGTMSIYCMDQGQLRGCWIFPWQANATADLLARLERQHALLRDTRKSLLLINVPSWMADLQLSTQLKAAGWQLQTQASSAALPLQVSRAVWPGFVAVEAS